MTQLFQPSNTDRLHPQVQGDNVSELDEFKDTMNRIEATAQECRTIGKDIAAKVKEIDTLWVGIRAKLRERADLIKRADYLKERLSRVGIHTGPIVSKERLEDSIKREICESATFGMRYERTISQRFPSVIDEIFRDISTRLREGGSFLWLLLVVASRLHRPAW